MRLFILSAVVAMGVAFGAPAKASDAVPRSIAERLDAVSAEFAMTAAKQRRLMMMQGAQPGAGRPAPVYGARPGYGPRPSYGPRPGYGPRAGYGPRYGYGPRAGYGPRPGYGPRGYYGRPYP